MEADTLPIDVGDTELGALRWVGREGAPTVIAVHGITANAWCWGPVARHLDGDVTVVAVDLRGRGASAAAPRPTGMRRHADDVAAVIDRIGADAPLTVAGHSMGTYVALMAAERHPALVGPLVLVDGAVALARPDGVDADEILDVGLGPAIARLQRTFADRDEYRSFWAAHPAFARTGLTAEIEAWLLSDLQPASDGFRSVVGEDAVRADGAELFLDDEVRSALDRVAAPATIIRAELGLLAESPPMVPADAPDRHPRHRWITVPGTNHYDVLVGETGAAAVADAIRAATGT